MMLKNIQATVMTIVFLFFAFGISYAELNVPFSIPERTIVIDGYADDWTGISAIIQDAENDNTCGSGTDMSYVYLAKDSEYLYWRIDAYGQHAIVSGTKYLPGIRVLQAGESARTDGDVECKLQLDYYDGTIEGFIDIDRVNDWEDYLEGSAYGAASGGVAEGKIPLSLFTVGTFTYIGAYIHNGVLTYGDCDYIQLTPDNIDVAGGYYAATDLWLKAVLQVATTPVTPITLVWKAVGTDTTPSGDKVVSGYFYADPNDFAYGSQYNPELFVKIYIATNGWCNIAFNHVTVDDVTVSSAHNYSGSANQTGTISQTLRLAEHQYSGVSLQ